MKKLTSITLVILFMTSFLASMDLTQMNDNIEQSEASGRSVGDPAVSAISSPKETSCNDLGCRDELLAGESVKISTFIKNEGTAPIDELGYTTTIYLSDSTGNPGLIAKDSSGSDLQWENPDVICDDGTICHLDSTQGGSLAPGFFLDGGKHTMLMQGGNEIVWTPTTGEYVIDVTVNSPTDDDPGNNAYQTYVKVVDWVDIKVDLAWTPAGQEPSDSIVSCDNNQCPFTLSVTLDGSREGAEIRDVQVLLKASGDATTAQLDNGAWITSADQTNELTGSGKTVTLDSDGTADVVRILENGSDPEDWTFNQNGTRNIITLGDENTASITGFLTPSTAAENAQWSLSAEIINYTLYGQYPECERMWNPPGDAENVTTFQDFCEIEETSDGYSRTDFSEIVGSATNVHDIRVSRVGVYQGFGADCSGTATSFLGVGDVGSLNVGCSQLYAEVEHRGTDPAQSYEWEMAYTITANGQTVDTGIVDTCLAVEPGSPVYMAVSGATPATVCVQVDLTPGDWEFTFDLSLNDNKFTDANGDDMRPSNNEVTLDVRVENNKPLITSLELNNEGDLIIGQADPLDMSAAAFDVDDPTGSSLTYEWSIPGGILPGCTTNQCQVPIIQDYVPQLAVSVVVTDEFGGVASEEIVLNIWNSQTGSDTTESEITVLYNVTYFLASIFELTAEDGSTEAHTGVDLGEYDYFGSYDAVGVVDYTPSATFTSGDILSQTLSVQTPKTMGATTMWYYDSQGRYILFDDAPSDDDNDATIDVFTYTFDPTQGILPSGQIVMFGGELVPLEPPVSEISGFSAAAAKGGAIRLNWDLTSSPLPGEEVLLKICEGDDWATCDSTNTFQTSPGEADRSYTYSGTNTQHGQLYLVYAAVCKTDDLCSTAGMASVIADKQVDGGVTVSGLQIQAIGEEWQLTWESSGDLSDTDAWKICSARNDNFDAANMPIDSCQTTDSSDDTTYNWAQPTSPGSAAYYFTVVPVDALGNIQAGAALNSIDYFREGATGGQDDNNTVGDQDATASGVPGWTWGVIGGIVLVALVAGGFILSRGEGGGDEGKDWDY